MLARPMSHRTTAERIVAEVLHMVQHASREDMSAALDTLVRQCDARLPMLPPSFLREPLTPSRVDRWTREDGVIAARRGAPVQVIARRLRSAVDHPRAALMQLLVEAWLPEEDALRWVVTATRDAVFRWYYSSNPPLLWLVMREALVPREARSASLTVIELSLAVIAQLGFVEEAVASNEAIATRGAAAIREVVAVVRAALGVVRAAADRSDEMSMNRGEVAALLDRCFVAIERGFESAAHPFSDASIWFGSAGIELADGFKGAVVRRRFHELDLERLLVDADARDALALASQEKAPQ
jgi:hypothetical protein